MATHTPIVDPQQATGRPARTGLKVTQYDQVASMLIALLILIGSATLLMLILWFTSRIFADQPAVPVTLEELGEGDGSLGEGMDLDAPDAEELGLDVELEEPQLEETLAAVADVVAANAAVLDSPALTDAIETGKGGRTGSGSGLGRGDGTGSGTGRGRRWKVTFADTTLEGYAEVLDYFRIELGVIMPGGRVEYASKLSQSRPERRSGRTEDEKRYYLIWDGGELEQVEHQLLDKAGITDHRGRPVAKFLEPDVEAQLQQKEKEAAGAEYNDVRTTYFGVKRAGRGYEFYVIDQAFR